MNFIDEKLEEFALAHTTPEPELLYDLNRQTHLKILQPRMLSGHLQGAFLAMLSQMIKPKCILEIGTYTGYSTLRLAEGLCADGKIITIDINEELEPFTRSFFDKSDYKSQIEFLLGNALELIPGLDIAPDLVFIDADKDNYSNYYNLVIEKMPPGGYIIADNVLWSGKVVQPVAADDKDTKALVEFCKMLQTDERVENMLLPFRDGLMLIRKK
jgi:caffeoyl-CoA O-methyltransferase